MSEESIVNAVEKVSKSVVNIASVRMMQDQLFRVFPVLVLEADFYPVFGGAVQGLPAVNAVKAMAQNVTGMKVPLSGHWIPEEQPDFVIKQLANFFGNNAVTNAVTR